MAKSTLKEFLMGMVLVGVVCILVFAAIRAFQSFHNPSPFVDAEKYPVNGIDVSRHNGKIDFRKVADDGFEFVFIKASEGVSHKDSLYRFNMSAAKRAGLKTGAYHFFRFDRDGVAQAINFLEAVGPHHPELGLVIDVESAGNPSDIPAEEVKKKLLSMTEYMQLMGHRVMFYTNRDGYYDYIEENFPDYPLWICRFQENPIKADFTFWQYDHHGKVAGINGDVDLNVFNGSRQDWNRFLAGEPYNPVEHTSKK